MRLLQGSNVVEAPAGWRRALAADRVVIDLGAGDGRWAYESARHDPASVYVAVDPDAAALSEYAFRAARKPARGGVANAVFVVAPVERLPPELNALAAVVRVNFPWGGLLRGLLRPEPQALRAVSSLVAPGGRFELVLTYEPGHDSGAAAEPLPALEDGHIGAVLVPAYAASGLVVEGWRRLERREALAIPSTWGRRLLHARQREVVFIEGTLPA